MKFLLISSEDDSDNNLRFNFKHTTLQHKLKIWKWRVLFYLKHVITQIVFKVLLWLMKYFHKEDYLLWNGQVFSTYVCAKT